MSVTYDTTGKDSTACPNGYNWHVHESWNNATATQGIGGTECGSGETGGHYIPNRPCSNITYPAADCAATKAFENCEVGDFSARYMPIPVNSSGSWTNQIDWYSIPSTFENRSVVVHCGSPRVSCGKIEMASGGSISTSAGTTYTATFADVFTGTVTLNSMTGQLTVDLDVINSTLYPAATTFGYHIHEKWTHASATSAEGANCGGSFTGGHWDPNHGCGPASQYASTNCSVCSGSTYACTPSAAAYACEAGDLSGRFGSLTVGAAGAVDYTSATGQFLFPSASDSGLSIVIHAAGGARVACASLVAPSPSPSPAPSPSSEAGLVIPSLISLVLAQLF